MPIDKNLPNLVINRVPTKEIYKKLKERNMINEDELYLVEDEDSDSSGGVGRQGLYETAEIFNDYENNIASGEFAHAEGKGTIAKGWAQHVQGQYNVPNENYLHIVGNGLSDDERSNAHTIDTAGNAWFSGRITVGGNSETTGVEVATLAKAEEWVFTLEDGSTVTKKVVLA